MFWLVIYEINNKENNITIYAKKKKRNTRYCSKYSATNSKYKRSEKMEKFSC